MALSNEDRQRAEKIAKRHGYQPAVVRMLEQFGRFGEQGGGACVLLAREGRPHNVPLGDGLPELLASLHGTLEEFREGRPVPEGYGEPVKRAPSPTPSARTPGRAPDLTDAVLERMLFED